MKRLNDATPADWDRVAREHPAIDPNEVYTKALYGHGDGRGSQDDIKGKLYSRP